MAPTREPKPFAFEVDGLAISGTAQYCGHNLRDYWVQFILEGKQYSFTLIMSGLGATPLYSVNCFFRGDMPTERKYITVQRLAAPQAFEQAIKAILEWRAAQPAIL